MNQAQIISLILSTQASAQVVSTINPPEFTGAGAEVLYFSWGNNQQEQYGYVSETIADLTGDTVPEMLNSAPFRAINGQPLTGEAFVHDGRTGDVIVTHSGNFPQGFFGWRLARLGDVNADGTDDYAIGAAGEIFRNNPTVEGQAFVYSGADHTLIRELNARDYASIDDDLGDDRFGQDISAIGDINADGHHDFIVTADLWDEAALNAGFAWVLSGADFSVIRTHSGDEAGDRFGCSTNPVGDLNDDSIPEYIVCARNGGTDNAGIAHVYDGASGSVLFSVRGDSGTMQNFGQYFVSSPGDCTGDGLPDIFVSDFTDSAAGQWTGSAYLFDGATGMQNQGTTIQPYWRVIGDQQLQSVGFGGGIGDVDHDGCADIATCFLANADSPDIRWAGQVRIFSGKTGKLLRVIASTEGDGPTFNNWGEQFGYSITPLGDANDDGEPDLFVTAGFGKDDQGQIVGRAYAIAGRTPCDADFDGDLDADFFDLNQFLIGLGTNAPYADLFPVGRFNFFDLGAFLEAFNAGCP